MGDPSRTTNAVRRLRQRWLEPSPPLAVDDEAEWRPAPDTAADPQLPEDEVAGQAVNRPSAGA